jgi:lysophospholipase L1-like esterase
MSVKGLLQKTFFGLLLIFTTAVLLEIALGIMFMVKDRDIQPENVKDFPYLYFLFDNTKSDEYNEHGFKTKYSIAKPENTYRIMLTGGSVARGTSKPELSIAAYLEKELKEKYPQKNVQVINAGVSAYGVQQEFMLIQMLLQHYKPDMIVALDGYNDMLTFKLNRFYPSGYALPPHHWKEFRIIKDKEFENKWFSRFSAPFYNTNRAKDFLIRSSLEKKYDWNSVTDSVAQQHADAFWSVVNDQYDFCRAKHIAYVNFLQPVRFYNRNSEPDDAELKALSKIYAQMESHYGADDFAHSLVPAFHKCKSMFTDDCHITPEGNQIIAKAMAEKIGVVLKDSLVVE